MSPLRQLPIRLLMAIAGLHLAPALLSAGALAADQASASASAPVANPNVVRPDMAKLLDDKLVRDSLLAKKYAEVKEQVRQAEAMPNVTPYERFAIDITKFKLAVATNDEQGAIAAVEAVVTSGKLPASAQLTLTMELGTRYYNAKSYAKAIEWCKRHQQESGDPTLARGVLARSYYFNNEHANAMRELKLIIGDAEKAGTTPNFDELRLMHSAAAKLKDADATAGALEKLISYYSKDEYWSDLLHKMQNKPKYDTRLDLDEIRLESVVLKAMDAEQYVFMAELALQSAFGTEAKKAMDAGYASGVLGTGSNAAKHKALRERANKAAADDLKTRASDEAAADKAKGGNASINLGYALVTMEQFDKGIELIQKGIAKGGLKYPEEAQLRLGMALALAGRKAEAIGALQKVKGNDTLNELARYWTLWLNRAQPAAPAAPAAAAAASAASK
ncbi:MAG: hypothetical protein V4582_01435 [Pseudomonadota bacterium]